MQARRLEHVESSNNSAECAPSQRKPSNEFVAFSRVRPGQPKSSTQFESHRKGPVGLGDEVGCPPAR